VNTVVDLRKFADMQHRNNSKSKISPLGLIQLDYFFNLGMNNCKASLPKRTLFKNLSLVLRVQDVYEETRYLFYVFPNWISQCKSN
jgi:hypothetical protein